MPWNFNTLPNVSTLTNSSELSNSDWKRNRDGNGSPDRRILQVRRSRVAGKRRRFTKKYTNHTKKFRTKGSRSRHAFRGCTEPPFVNHFGIAFVCLVLFVVKILLDPGDCVILTRIALPGREDVLPRNTRITRKNSGRKGPDPITPFALTNNLIHADEQPHS